MKRAIFILWRLIVGLAVYVVIPVLLLPIVVTLFLCVTLASWITSQHIGYSRVRGLK